MLSPPVSATRTHASPAGSRVPGLTGGVRVLLLALALGLVGVFTLACWLDPYRDGRVWLQGTHQQLGLPPCRFWKLTGRPCPTCGMTSSFALLMHGDLGNSLRANAVGTLLALVGLACIPWAVCCAWRGRLYLIRAPEAVLVRLVVFFCVLMLLRWLVVILWGSG